MREAYIGTGGWAGWSNMMSKAGSRYFRASERRRVREERLPQRRACLQEVAVLVQPASCVVQERGFLMGPCDCQAGQLVPTFCCPALPVFLCVLVLCEELRPRARPVVRAVQEPIAFCRAEAGRQHSSKFRPGVPA